MTGKLLAVIPVVLNGTLFRVWGLRVAIDVLESFIVLDYEDRVTGNIL